MKKLFASKAETSNAGAPASSPAPTPSPTPATHDATPASAAVPAAVPVKLATPQTPSFNTNAINNISTSPRSPSLSISPTDTRGMTQQQQLHLPLDISRPSRLDTS